MKSQEEDMGISHVNFLLEELPESSLQSSGVAVEVAGQSWLDTWIRYDLVLQMGKLRPKGGHQPRSQGSLAMTLVSGDSGALVFGPS